MVTTISIESSERTELIDITAKIEKIIKKNNINEGMCYLHVPHTTAGITINENADPDVSYDIKNKMDTIIARDDNYTHLEGNSDGHIKSSLFGPTLNLIIENGNILLGRWQCIYFCEFDGPRNRNIWVKIISC